MKSKIYLSITLLLILCSSHLFATPLISQEEITSSNKRPASSSLDEPASKRQVFARPTFDSTVKYLFDDADVRLDFIKTFTGITNITSSEKLDNALNPLHSLTNVREILNESITKKLMNEVANDPHKFMVVEKDIAEKGKDIEREPLSRFLRTLSNNFEDIIKVFPKERGSQVNLLCRLSNNELALVEIQVAKQDFWDNRALAYLGSIYGGQLQAGDKWPDLKKVIGINILGGGPSNVAYWRDQKNPSKKENPIRHYQFKDDQSPPHIIDGIDLIQYSLGDTDINSVELQQKKDLRDWLDYFKNAQNKEKVPDNINDKLKKAYERVKFDTMPKDVQESYEKEKQYFENFKEHEEIVKINAEEKGKKEGIELGRKEIQVTMAQKMLSKGIKKEEIAEMTGLTLEEIEKIKINAEEKGKKEGIELGKKKIQVIMAQKMFSKGIKKEKIAEMTGLTLEEIEKI